MLLGYFSFSHEKTFKTEKWLLTENYCHFYLNIVSSLEGVFLHMLIMSQ